MTVAILIEESPLETRIARVEAGRLAALDILRIGEESRIGAIWLGRVRRVVPGMEAAFVDIGEPKAGFLGIGEARARRPDAKADAGIGALVQEGEKIVVQAIRDPVGEKGVRLTTAISLTGRDLVLTPLEPGIRVSRKIPDDAARKRLSALVADLAPGLGFIVRTAAAQSGDDVLAAEIAALTQRWDTLASMARIAAPPRLMAEAPDPVLSRVLEAGASPDAIVVEGRSAYARLRGGLQSTAPQLLDRLRLHADRESLFDRYGIDGAVDLALARRVPLSSGGAVVIEPTEALTAIDVDGGGVGATGDAEAARLRINLEAAAEIARQVRLRDIGGVIVIDFIRLKDPEARARLSRSLEEGFAGDQGAPRIAPLSPFGLVEMTRRRTGAALDARLTEACDPCGGSGRRPTATAIAAEAARQIARLIRTQSTGTISITAAPEIAKLLEQHADKFELPVEIVADPALPRGKFDIGER